MGKGLIDAGMCEHSIRSLLDAGVRRNDDTRAGARLRAWLAEYERITGREYPTPTKEGA